MFSKTFGYALRAVVFVFIHANEEARVGLHEISEKLDVPRHFLGKIMQDLVRHGIIDSVKGPNGGFYANAETAKTVLTEILRITDGSNVFEQCALGIKRCSSTHPCPLHKDFAVCRNGMLKIMEAKTVGMLATDVRQGLAFLAALHENPGVD